MKHRKTIVATLVCAFVLSANAQVQTPVEGWNLMGATELMNVTDIPCADTVWVYDPSSQSPWSLYKKENITTNNYGFPLVTQIAQGKGFWVLSPGCETITNASGVLVDPYIQNAILCQDTNSNGVCGSDEPTSTSTTATGEFSFSEPLTAGKNIIIKVQGEHEGVPFDLKLSGVVASDGSIDVVSPLTTFESKGLSATQIANVLTQAASHAYANDQATLLANFVVEATTILENPLEGDLMNKSISEINNDDLKHIQASLASYGILKIMEGSQSLSALSSTELENSGTTQGSPVNLIARAMLKSISQSLNKELLQTISTGISEAKATLVNYGLSQSNANAALVEPKVGMIISIATKIINAIAQEGYEVCNATQGTVEQKVGAALNAAQTKAAVLTQEDKVYELGLKLYGVTYQESIKSNMTTPFLTGLSNAVPHLAQGINSTATTFVFDENNAIVEYSAQ